MGALCRDENIDMNSKIFRKMGQDRGLRSIKNGDGEDLVDELLDDGDNDSQHTAN